VSRELLLAALRRLPAATSYAELDQAARTLVDWAAAGLVVRDYALRNELVGLKMVSVLDAFVAQASVRILESTGWMSVSREDLDWPDFQERVIAWDASAADAVDDIGASVAVLPLPADHPGQRWTLRTTTAAWLAAHRSPHTRRAYLRNLADFLTWLEAHNLAPTDVRGGEVDCYLAELWERPKPPSPASQRRLLAALSSWYAYLDSHGLAPRNPVTAVDRPPIDRDHSPTVGLTVAEVQALLHVLDRDVGYRKTTSPLHYTALRNRALLGLLITLGCASGRPSPLTSASYATTPAAAPCSSGARAGAAANYPFPRRSPATSTPTSACVFASNSAANCGWPTRPG
jgi:hypothetical protein